MQSKLEGQVSMFIGRLPNSLPKAIQEPYLGVGSSIHEQKPRIVFASQLPFGEQGVLCGSAIHPFNRDTNAMSNDTSNEHMRCSKVYDSLCSEIRAVSDKHFENNNSGVVNILENCMKSLPSHSSVQTMKSALKKRSLPPLSLTYNNSSTLPSPIGCQMPLSSSNLKVRLSPVLSPERTTVKVYQHTKYISPPPPPPPLLDEENGVADMYSDVTEETAITNEMDRASASCSVTPVSSPDSSGSWQSFENTLTPLDIIEKSERERCENSERMNLNPSLAMSTTENGNLSFSQVVLDGLQQNTDSVKCVPLSDSSSFGSTYLHSMDSLKTVAGRGQNLASLSKIAYFPGHETHTCKNVHNELSQSNNFSEEKTIKNISVRSRKTRENKNCPECVQDHFGNCVTLSALQDLKRIRVDNSSSNSDSYAFLSDTVDSSCSRDEVSSLPDDCFVEGDRSKRTGHDFPRVSALAAMQLPISSFMGMGTTYVDNPCFTSLSVPRYSAVPRSLSMLVNVSSDNSSNEYSSDSGSLSSPSSSERDSNTLENTNRKRGNEHSFLRPKLHEYLRDNHNFHRFSSKDCFHSEVNGKYDIYPGESFSKQYQTDILNNTHAKQNETVRHSVHNINCSTSTDTYQINQSLWNNHKRVEGNSLDSNISFNNTDNKLASDNHELLSPNSYNEQEFRKTSANSVSSSKGTSIPNRFSMSSNINLAEMSDISSSRRISNEASTVSSQHLPSVVTNKNVPMRITRSPVRTLFSNGHIIRIPEHAFIPNYPPDFRIKFKKKFETIPEERSVSLESSVEGSEKTDLNSTDSTGQKKIEETKERVVKDYEEERTINENPEFSEEKVASHIMKTIDEEPSLVKIEKSMSPTCVDFLSEVQEETVSENHENNKFINVGTSTSSIDFNSHKGKAALTMDNESDLVSQSKGWINFYMLKDDAENVDMSADESQSSRRDSVKRTVTVVGGEKRLRRQSARDYTCHSCSENSSVRSSSAAPESRRISLTCDPAHEESWLMRNDCCDMHLAKFLHYAETLPLHLIPLPASRRTSVVLRGSTSALRMPGIRADNYFRYKVEDQQSKIKPSRNFLPQVQPNAKQRPNQKRVKDPGIRTGVKKKGTEISDLNTKCCNDSSCLRSNSRLSTRCVHGDEESSTMKENNTIPRTSLSVTGSAIPPRTHSQFPWGDSSKQRPAASRFSPLSHTQ